MKRVLITGATGFIGQSCLKALQQKDFTVYGLSTEKITQATGDITWCQADLHDYRGVKELLAHIRPSHLLHLAWYVKHGIYWSSEKNLQWVASSLNLIQEFANNGGRRVVCSGTCAEYDWGKDLGSESFSELSTPVAPQTLYGACKASLQTTVESLSKNLELSFAWGRLFFPYGPGESPERLIPSTVQSLLKGEAVTCNNPELSRDFIFIDDVAQIFAALLDSNIRGPINIASGHAAKLRQVVDLIGKHLNAEHLIEYKVNGNNTSEPVVLCGDVTRLKNELRLLPNIEMEEGIGKTIAWWREKLTR